MGCSPPKFQTQAVTRRFKLGDTGPKIGIDLPYILANTGIDFDVALHQFWFGTLQHCGRQAAQNLLDRTGQLACLSIAETKLQLDTNGRITVAVEDQLSHPDHPFAIQTWLALLWSTGFNDRTRHETDAYPNDLFVDIK
jgi:hypothetical protein